LSADLSAYTLRLPPLVKPREGMARTSHGIKGKQKKTQTQRRKCFGEHRNNDQQSQKRKIKKGKKRESIVCKGKKEKRRKIPKNLKFLKAGDGGAIGGGGGRSGKGKLRSEESRASGGVGPRWWGAHFGRGTEAATW